MESSFVAFSDLERIEVLKGPQGTLYGRNAIAGAVNVITRSPRLGEYSGFTQLSVGDYDARGVTADPSTEQIFPVYGRNAWKSRLRAQPDVAAAHGYVG